MNTANLQIEGLLMAFSALNHRLIASGVLTREEIGDALDEAVQTLSADTSRNLSDANLKAILFPVRFLSDAVRATQDEADHTFAEETRRIGRDDTAVD